MDKTPKVKKLTVSVTVGPVKVQAKSPIDEPIKKKLEEILKGK